MDIRLLSEDKLRIFLDRRDMDALGITYRGLDCAGGFTKEALLTLLAQAKDEVGFSPRSAKLFIEAYQKEEEGCVLYFTVIRKPSRLDGTQAAIQPVVFEFDCLEDLINGACKTFERYSHRIYKSSLYLIDGKYRLLVYCLDYCDRLSVYFLSEYAAKLSEDEIFAAHTAEYGKELIADTALDTLSRYFG